ncbi:myosin heavy chain, clone [Tritrichomonas foetus]|uniref:Myosin heavy chain, clone n=1 Tax=Tritrichomonas foetus TaxID=1144522 RepID=A0A1J4J733_9EUKA|nr:myosin heavy chain, clone [Tritrichomonas foetus]|eukprot:OHS94465.1 myosin heavy chain, clone [Tritrichomonas foetus]
MNILGSVESETYQRLVVTLRQLKNKIKSLESECETLKKEVQTAHQKRTLLHNKLQSMKSVVVNDKTKDTENAMILLKIRDLKSEHEQNVNNLNELKNHLEHAVNSLCTERKKRRNVEAKTAKIIENIKNLSVLAQKLQGDPNQVKKNEALNNKLEEKKNRWKVTKHQLSSQIKAMQAKRDEALDSVHNTQIQIDLRVGLIDELNAKVEKRNQTISKLKNDVSLTKEEIEKVQASLLEKRKEVDQLSNKEETLKEDIIKAKNALSTIKAKYEKEREKLKAARIGYQQLQEGIEKKIEMMREESRREIAEKLEPLEEQVHEKDLIIKQYKEKLEDALSNKESAVSKLKALEAEREKERKAFIQTKAQFEAKCQAMQKAIGSITATSIPASGF